MERAAGALELIYCGRRTIQREGEGEREKEGEMQTRRGHRDNWHWLTRDIWLLRSSGSFCVLLVPIIV